MSNPCEQKWHYDSVNKLVWAEVDGTAVDVDFGEPANGRIAAAAPDMARELRNLVLLLEPLEHEGRLNVPGLDTLNAARAAIIKAGVPL